MREFTIRLGLEFDSARVGEPDPWWRPFAWFLLNRNNPANYESPGFVLRFGALGFHVLIAAHYYPKNNHAVETMES